MLQWTMPDNILKYPGVLCRMQAVPRKEMAWDGDAAWCRHDLVHPTRCYPDG